MLNMHNTMFSAVTQILADTGAIGAPFTVIPSPLPASAVIAAMAGFCADESQMMGELTDHIAGGGSYSLYHVSDIDGTLGYVWQWHHANGAIERVYAHPILGG